MKERNRERELPRISVSMSKQQMAALRRRALRLGVQPQQVILDCLAGIDAQPPISVCFPALTSVRYRLDDCQRRIDGLAAVVLQQLGTNERAEDILAELGKVHMAIEQMTAQLKQGA